MVLGQEKDMLHGAQADQPGAHQGALGQIKGGGSLLGAEPGECGLGRGDPGQVVLDEQQALLLRQKPHLRRTAGRNEDTAQGLVPGPQAVKRPPPGHSVERSFDAQRQRHMIGRTGGRIELGQEP
jgi:hypothetical protein